MTKKITLNEELNDLKKILTYQQLLFVDAILKGNPAIVAYETAGLTTGTANDTIDAEALLQAPKVKLYIDALQRRVTTSSAMSLQAIDNKLSDLAMTNLIDLVDFGDDFEDENGNIKTPVKLKNASELTVAQRSAITTLKTSDGGLEIKTVDKLKALDMLIKRRGGYTEVQKVEHTGKIDVVAFVGDNGRGGKK